MLIKSIVADALAAIDLDNLVERLQVREERLYRGVEKNGEGKYLGFHTDGNLHGRAAAAIEALRARVADTEADYLRRHNEAIDCFEKLKAAEAKVRLFSDHRADLLETLDIADARVAELEGALEAWQFVYPGVTAEDTETANRIV